SYNNTQTVDLPVGISDQYYFFVQTAPNSVVFQNNQTANNVGSTATAETVNLTPPPDLTTSILTAPLTGLASHDLTFTYKVTNRGAGGTPNTGWNDAYYLSTTPDLTGTYFSLGQQSRFGALAAGGSYTNTVTVTIPDGLSGNYYLVVDSDIG